MANVTYISRRFQYRFFNGKIKLNSSDQQYVTSFIITNKQINWRHYDGNGVDHILNLPNINFHLSGCSLFKSDKTAIQCVTFTKHFREMPFG